MKKWSFLFIATTLMVSPLIGVSAEIANEKQVETITEPKIASPLAKIEKQLASITKGKNPEKSKGKTENGNRKISKSSGEVSAKGTWGTSKWKFSNGVLTLGAGQLGESSEAPWISILEDGVDARSIDEVVFSGKVKAPANSSGLFASLISVKKYKNISNLDTTLVVDMSEMFADNYELTELDVSHFDTSKVTTLEGTFQNTAKLKKLDVSTWKTSNVKTMRYLFYNAGMDSLDVKDWDTSSVENMSATFSGTKFKTLDVGKWDTSKVTEMVATFSSSRLKELNFENWSTESVTESYDMFNVGSSMDKRLNGLAKFTIGDKFQFVSSNRHFSPSESLPTTGNWVKEDGTGQAYTPYHFVQYYGTNSTSTNKPEPGTYVAEVDKDADLSKPVTVEYLDASTYIPISEERIVKGSIGEKISIRVREIDNYKFKEADADLDVVITDKEQTLKLYYDFASDVTSGTWGSAPWEFKDGILTVKAGELDRHPTAPWRGHSRNLPEINASEIKEIVFEGKVKAPVDSQFLFSGLEQNEGGSQRLANLEKITNLENFDTSEVTNLSRMFVGAVKLKELDLTSWNTENVTNMSEMFMNTPSLEKLSIDTFKMSKVTTIASMFSGCGARSLDIANWDTSSLTTMNNAFYHAKMTNLDLSGWDTSNVTSMRQTFMQSTIRDLNLANWDTSQVANNGMTRMFNPDPERDLHSGLTRITLGKNFEFKGYKMQYTNPALNPWLGMGIGEWIREDGSTASYLPEDFMEQYGSGELVPGTYVVRPAKSLVERPITVYYEDEDGNEIKSPDKLTGEYGDKKKIEIPEIEGYKYIKADKSLDMSINWDQQSITLTYKDMDESSINVKNTTIAQGSKWLPEDNFIGGTDEKGNELNFKDVEVEGEVDTSVLSHYFVEYKYGKVSEMAVITVVEKPERPEVWPGVGINKTSVEAENSTIVVDSKWEAKDNFIKATDKLGVEVKLEDVNVTGKVDTSTVGKYDVIYEYGGVSTVITVTVVEKPERPEVWPGVGINKT
ncbi:BspA family leucine-rich repeat surface protein, partial [Vagococcus fessus]